MNVDQTPFVQSIGSFRQEVWIGFLQMCDREVGQALSREKCPVGTVDLEPELGDTRVGVANPRSFIFNTGLEIGPDKFV